MQTFLSIDPLTKDYAMLTPYQFASNKPINGVDLDGLEWVLTIYSPDLSTSFKQALSCQDIIEQRRITTYALSNMFTHQGKRTTWPIQNLIKNSEKFPKNFNAASLLYDESYPNGLTVYTTSDDKNGNITYDKASIFFQTNKEATLFEGKYDDLYWPVDLGLYDSNGDASGSNYYGDSDVRGVSYSASSYIGAGGGAGRMLVRMRGYGLLQYSTTEAGTGFGISFLDRADFSGSFVGEGSPTPFNFAGNGEMSGLDVSLGLGVWKGFDNSSGSSIFTEKVNWKGTFQSYSPGIDMGIGGKLDISTFSKLIVPNGNNQKYEVNNN